MPDETSKEAAPKKEKSRSAFSKLLSRDKPEKDEDEAMTMEEESTPLEESRPDPVVESAPAKKAAEPTVSKGVSAGSELRRNPVMNRKHQSIVGQKKPGARKYFTSR